MRQRSNIREDATCTVCRSKVDIMFPIRSNTWAYGMVGVRMMLCSVECRRVYDKEMAA